MTLAKPETEALERASQPDAATTVAEAAAMRAVVLCDFADAQDIASPAHAQWATNTAHMLREQLRLCEGERDAVAKPLRKLASDHADRWNPTIKRLDATIRKLKDRTIAYELAAQAEQAAALAEATSAEEVAAAVAVVAPPPEGLSKRVDWGWELVDYAAVPREYLVIDKFRIDKLAREQKDALDIPGIRPVAKTIGVLR
jgi:hypothetical protein